MFLHRVKRNWQRYQVPAVILLGFAFMRILLEEALGYPPLNGARVLRLTLILIAGSILWAFLKTVKELWNTYWKTLCTFVVALRKFCRDYWSKTAAA